MEEKNFLDDLLPEVEQKEKQMELAHADMILKEISSLDLFMQNNNLSQLPRPQPEIIKPDLAKIKAFYKMSGKVPQGCTLIESADKFSIKLKQNGVLKNGASKTRTRGEQPDED